MEQVTPQMGEAQGALQLLLLNAGQALQLSQLIKQSADGVEQLTAANSRWVLR
jgi:NADP-dependent 3-hydroxy acid dehydrogenase YdfG